MYPALMRFAYTLLCLIFLGHFAGAQTFLLDSLKRELKKGRPDSVKADLYLSIGGEFINLKPDSAKYFIDRAHQLALDLHNKKYEAGSLNYLGRYYSSQGQYYNAADYFLKCLNITGYFAERELRTVTYYDLGEMYSAMRRLSGSDELYDKQRFYYKKSIEMFHQMKTAEIKENLRMLEAKACIELGRAFMSGTNDSVKLDSAVYFFEKAYQLSDSLKSFEVKFNAVEGIGRVYFIRKQYDKALHEAHRLLRLSKKEGGPFFVGMANVNLGTFYTNILYAHIPGFRFSFDSARYYWIESLKKFKPLEIDSQFMIPAVYERLGQIHKSNKSYREAIAYYDLVREYAKKTGMKDIEESYVRTAEAYAALGDHKKAYEFLSLYISLKDSLLNEDTSAKLVRLQANAESAHQLDQIELLEKEAQVKELLLQQKQNQQILIGVIALLFLVLIGFLFVRNRLINRTKNEQEKLFREVDQIKARFFANLSHEFRTPLTLLLGPIEKRLALSNSPEDRSELSVMHRNASRLLRLVDQLLDLSRFEAGTIRLRASAGELVGFTRTVMSSFQSMADSKGIRFPLKCAEDAVMLYFDPDKIEKVLNNLFSNAFKFTPEGGEIIVEVSQRLPDSAFKEGRVEIHVKDSGIGIAPEHLPKLFDRFYQVDSSMTRAFEGSGIGLALTKELVDLHHGKIAVESEVGKGTTLIVQLPLGSAHLRPEQITLADMPAKAPDFLAEPISEESAVEEVDPGEWVLVIEDNADLREHLRKELTPGYRIVLAKDGEEGIQLALKDVPTLIISDLMMPRKNGMEVCAMIKEDERTSHIPIILLTAKADAESRLEGFKKGADDYIAKPFSMNELRVRIDNLIEGRRKLQKKYAQHAIVYKPGETHSESIEEKFLKKAVNTIEVHIGDAAFSVEVFAREVGMSQVQLYRKLTALTNYSPNEFVRHMRLQRASDLLVSKAGNVAEIADQCGFNSLSYFSKVFKEKFGVTPSEVLKKESTVAGHVPKAE